MSEPRLISPMLDNFVMGDPISDRNGVRCCPALRNITDDRYIVKIISTPASQVQVDALLLSGAFADKDAALSYFKSLSDDIVREAEVLSRLSRLEGFLGFESCQVEPMEDEIGFDVYLLSPYRRSVQQYLRHNAPTHLEALNLGLDLCAALTVCRQSGYLYVDLKPGNIYITQDQGYKIGDLGFVELRSLKYASLPERYRSQYTAPEISDAYAALNTTIDIYALGLILYQVFNGGVLPFKGDSAPAEQFPAPAYADYEMAEIILKACAPDPAERWQDPADLGQALVTYMQRNGAHDTPITPVAESADAPSYDEDADGSYESSEELQNSGEEQAAPIENTDDAAADEANNNAAEVPAQNDSGADEEITEEAIFTEDEEGNLTFLSDDEEDETSPANDEDSTDYNEVTEEVSDILQQADALIAHQAPAPVVQPEPIDVPIPAPLPPEEPATPSTADEENETPETLVDGDAADSATKDSACESDAAQEAAPSEDAETMDDDADTDEDEDLEEEPVRKPKHWVRNILLILLLLGLLVGGYFFYQNYYLQSIDAITLEETAERFLVVRVESEVSDELLQIVCSDTYGNQIRKPVTNGMATFRELAPNTTYTVSVEISGFHGLTGNTSSTYTTPKQTKIVQINCVTGAEDGSVIISFTVDGTDAPEWLLSYTDADGALQETTFENHSMTLTGLTIGHEYTFRIAPVDTEILVTGQSQIAHTASRIVKAQDLQIAGCVDGKLTATWNPPAGTQVSGWTVRCKNDAGYMETTEVTDCTAAFQIPDETLDYTVEVTASGMSVPEKVTASAADVSISMNLDTSSPAAYKLTWQVSEGEDTQWTAEGGWILQYTVNGTYSLELECQTPEAVIAPVIPGAKCSFTLKAVDGTQLLGNSLYYTAEPAKPFEGYAVNADTMLFKMCRTPSWSNWDRYDLSSSDYTTEFEVGEKASFLVQMLDEYNTSDDEITTVYVIRNAEGNIVDASFTTQTWKQMWRRNYCELDIPSIPQTPGAYQISVYFNGGLAAQVDFTVVSD